MILNPEWATEAVYKLVDCPAILENKGRFHFDDLKNLWDQKKFPREKHKELVHLMEKFELCFPVMDSDIHIVPELLPHQQPCIDFAKYKQPGCRRFQYHYDFMPRGMISRFISRLYYLILQEHFWKSGVELRFEDSTALVLAEPLNRKIKISVTGSSQGGLLAIIRNDFEHIHRSLNMEKNKHYKEMVPCTCPTCLEAEEPHLFRYDELKRYAEKRITNMLPCPLGMEMVEIEVMLKGYESPVMKTDLKDLLTTLVNTGSHLQGIARTIKAEEDSRNSFMALVLTIQGYIVKDQTRRGSSERGISMGELDMLVETPDGEAFSVIEAFNLKSFNRTVIDSHVKKIFGYDANGLESNFIMVYAEDANFLGLWKKYMKYLQEIDFQYQLTDPPKEIPTRFTDIKLALAQHKREGKITGVYHIFIKMAMV